MSLQGRNREAWEVIEPALESGQGAVMSFSAQILEKLGRTDEAYAIARRLVDRYPDVPAFRSVLASMLWRLKRYSEAAFVLDPPEQGYKVGAAAFRDDVSARFAETFAKASDEVVVSAFSAMKSQGIRSRSLAFLLPPVSAAGRHELAFRLQASLTWPNQHVWEVADWRREGFGYLEKAQGRAAAVAWIQSVIPPGQLDDTLSAMFNKKAWTLLWDTVPPTEEPRRSDWVWLLRVGAATVDPPTAAAHRPALLEHYRESRPGDAMRALGRYLLGLESREAVLGSAASSDDRCRAAYFSGLQDVAADRYEDASDWFQLVAATCSKPTSWELVGFAQTTLGEWYTFDRDLRAAAVKKVW